MINGFNKVYLYIYVYIWKIIITKWHLIEKCEGGFQRSRKEEREIKMQESYMKFSINKRKLLNILVDGNKKT